MYTQRLEMTRTGRSPLGNLEIIVGQTDDQYQSDRSESR
jgi:hypothetical protein